MRFTDNKGNGCELPKLTLALSERMDAISATKANAERYRLQWEFVRDVCGDDFAAKALDGEDVADIDLVALNVVYIGIVNTYTAPAIKAQMSALMEQTKALKPFVSAIEAAKR